MKYTCPAPSVLVALATLAGTCAATLAAPRESVTFNAIASNDLQNGALNTVVTNAFSGSDGAGVYNARYLTISGTMTEVSTATFSHEASILITPPTGTPFIACPIPGGGYTGSISTPANTYVLPVDAITTAGTWSFRFFETFNDGGATVDANWDTITFTLDDGTPPAAPAVSGPLSTTLTDINVDGIAAAPGFTTTVNLPSGTTVAGFRVVAQATMLTADPAANLGAGTNACSNLRVRVTPPGGTALVAQPIANNSGSTSVGDLLVSLPATQDSGGAWVVDVYTNDDNAGIDAKLHSLGFQLITLDPPAATNLGTLVNGVEASGTVAVGAGETKWFKFTLADTINATFNRALELDTEGSAAGDTSLALFSSSGTRVAFDFLDGTDSFGTLSFGSDNRPAPGNGLAYNGRDGATVASGEYYVAVTAGDTGVTYQPGLFGVTNTSTLAGDVTLRARYFDPGAVAPTAENLGNIVTGVTTTDTETLNAGQVKWYTFTTTRNLGTILNSALEIDTVGSTAGQTTGAGNTALALYRSVGTLVNSDLADGTGSLARLSYGNSGRPADPAIGTDLAGVAYTGQDGAFLAAGTYYLAAIAGDTGNVFAANWTVTTTSTVTGPVTVNIIQKENVVAPATPPTAQDLGLVGANNSPVSATVNVAAPTDIFWFKFRTSADLTATNGLFLDIDDEGSVLTGTGTNPSDTEIGFYTDFGGLIASDDDDGTGVLSQLSFGPSATTRPAPGDGATYNGRDGSFIPAGTYYVSAGIFNLNFAGAFATTHTDSARTTGTNGTLQLNIRTNIPGRCSPADVGVQGGGLGQDNRLDNNDFVAFINLFFAQDPSADVGVQGGGPGSDGQWDNNDFVAFINFFFNDAANCTG